MARELIYKDDARRAILKANPSIAFCIDNIKAVDAKAVVRGRWLLPKESYGFVCSVCGGSCWYYDYEQTIGESNYCPNCGADMRGMEDG